MGNTAAHKGNERPSLLSSHANSITPLYEACRDGDEERVRALLPNYSHEDLNRQEAPYGGNTCLHVAAANGHDPIVNLLINRGCYRSRLLNAHKQSAYDLAVQGKESTEALFCRREEKSASSDSRFHDQSVAECFDIVNVGNEERQQCDEQIVDDDKSTSKLGARRSTIITFKSEEEKEDEIDYSACSKAMCQSSIGRFFVNRFHGDAPLDFVVTSQRLENLLRHLNVNDEGEFEKAKCLLDEFQQSPHPIEQLIHLYTLETEFYRALKHDCLPLAIPIFVQLPKLKEHYFKGRVYRGIRMTDEELTTYQLVMAKRGTLLQTRSFSSTSIDRCVAEEFAFMPRSSDDKHITVLFVFDFPELCDQAINLSRISKDEPCLSEYADEQEVLILPWTLFEVSRVRKASDEDHTYTIYLTNVLLPRKNLLSTFKWSWIEMKKQFTNDRKIQPYSHVAVGRQIAGELATNQREDAVRSIQRSMSLAVQAKYGSRLSKV